MGCSPWGCKESGMTEQLTVQEASLFCTPSLAFIVHRVFDDGCFDLCKVVSREKAMAPHSSTLA